MKEEVKNILITGEPGVGKTTLVKKVIKELSLKAGGFYTDEIRVGGARKGFKICSFEGVQGILAFKDLESPYRVGSYGVNLKDLEEVGVKAVLKAISEAEIVVIDEIGKMELFSSRFRKAVLSALESPKPVLATVKMRPCGCTLKIKDRKDVLFFWLKEKNRKEVEEKVKEKLREILKL